jgi:hypothetical protein
MFIRYCPKVDETCEIRDCPLAYMDRAADLEKIQECLRQRQSAIDLLSWLLDEIQNRLTQLSDQPIHQAATKLMTSKSEAMALVLSLPFL